VAGERPVAFMQRREQEIIRRRNILREEQRGRKSAGEP
jgi:hypothetical protein